MLRYGGPYIHINIYCKIQTLSSRIWALAQAYQNIRLTHYMDCLGYGSVGVFWFSRVYTLLVQYLMAKDLVVHGLLFQGLMVQFLMDQVLFAQCWIDQILYGDYPAFMHNFYYLVVYLC